MPLLGPGLSQHLFSEGRNLRACCPTKCSFMASCPNQSTPTSASCLVTSPPASHMAVVPHRCRRLRVPSMGARPRWRPCLHLRHRLGWRVMLGLCCRPRWRRLLGLQRRQLLARGSRRGMPGLPRWQGHGRRGWPGAVHG
jgi:hypothetical protein